VKNSGAISVWNFQTQFLAWCVTQPTKTASNGGVQKHRTLDREKLERQVGGLPRKTKGWIDWRKCRHNVDQRKLVKAQVRSKSHIVSKNSAKPWPNFAVAGLLSWYSQNFLGSLFGLRVLYHSSDRDFYGMFLLVKAPWTSQVYLIKFC